MNEWTNEGINWKKLFLHIIHECLAIALAADAKLVNPV